MQLYSDQADIRQNSGSSRMGEEIYSGSLGVGNRNVLRPLGVGKRNIPGFSRNKEISS